jgi:L-glyceraldehyde 3-phosphate reductase
VHLPAVSLGLWHNFGADDDPARARKILLRAWELGITHFDLANNYGPPKGSAEVTFGKILKKNLKGERDRMFISTKAGYRMWEGPYGDGGSRKYLVASCDQSLQRMGLEYVDLFYSHRFDPDTPLEETMGALDFLVRSGRALYVGISSYDPEQTKRAAAILHRLGTPCLIHQPSHNLLDRWMENGLTGVLREQEMGCAIFSPLCQGILTGKYLAGIPEDSRAGSKHGWLRPKDVTEERLGKVRRLEKLAHARGQNLTEFAISWTLRDPVVTTAIFGASRPAHVDEAVRAASQTSFSREELDRVDAITL